jgi:hypothetical protein
VDDEDVVKRLARLSGWRRLEIGIGTDGLIGGYCITGDNREVDTRQALRTGRYSVVLLELSALRRASGWRRLEILGEPGCSSAGGWCERADGSGLHVSVLCGWSRAP